MLVNHAMGGDCNISMQVSLLHRDTSHWSYTATSLWYRGSYKVVKSKKKNLNFPSTPLNSNKSTHGDASRRIPRGTAQSYSPFPVPKQRGTSTYLWIQKASPSPSLLSVPSSSFRTRCSHSLFHYLLAVKGNCGLVHFSLWDPQSASRLPKPMSRYPAVLRRKSPLSERERAAGRFTTRP